MTHRIRGGRTARTNGVAGVSGRLCLAAILALLAMASGCQPPSTVPISTRADFYVATNGNDAWSGRLPSPALGGVDGPFATITRARDAIRQLRAQTGRARTYTVLVRGGVYRLDGPIVFLPEDSGAEGAPVVYAAFPGERPVLSGGRIITGWTKGTGKVWTVRVVDLRTSKPGAAARSDQPWYFHQLFVNGQRRTRARTPNAGYLKTDGPLPEFKNPRAHRQNPKAKMGFRYKAGDLKRWANLEDVNLFVYHSWTASLHWIRGIDEPTRTVRFTAPSAWPMGYWDRKQRYVVENCLEALDSPGEWYFDRKARLLHYLPMPGEDVLRAVVEAPALTELVRFDGDPTTARFVQHIVLNGLSFQHADWAVPNRGRADGQAATFLDGAAVRARGARNCSLERCEIARVGGYALWLGQGCKNNRVAHCHIHDMGAGGIRIGETTSARNEYVEAGANTVDNCFVHNGGNVFPAGVGVWIGRSSGNAVTHNDISDFYYTGVSVGWSWGYAPSSANNNRIEHNHIHHIGQGVLSDMGGIYALGVSPGTRLCHNLIHDIHSYNYGGWGLYTDEGSSGILLENNIVFNTKTGGFHQHYGRDNTVRNNLFAYSRQAQIIRSRQEPRLSFTFQNNIVYCDHDAVLGGNWRDGNYRLDNNLYWVATREAADFAGRDFIQWQETGQDRNSLVADPLFVDPLHYDFTLRRGSPALRVGYKPIDARGIGLYGEPEWVNAPRFIAHTSTLPPLASRKPIRDDFEATAIGQPAADATTGGEAKGAAIRVTDITAATGKHSLRFTDAQGLPQPWQPHLYYACRHLMGTVRLSFDLRMDPGAVLWHEWRSAGGQYHAGPSLRFGAKGELVAAAKELMVVPLGQWVHVEITCVLGRAATATYDLSVRLRDGTVRQFRRLPCSSPSFRRFEWLGFMSLAADRASFYVDNLRVERLD